MNKKGFTIVEVIVSFSIMAVVMLAIVTFMITYRDKVKNAEVETQLLDYKNILTKIIYDEIVRGNYIAISTCSTYEANSFLDGACAYFLKDDGGKDFIGIKRLDSKVGKLGKGLYLVYAGDNYLLPDSDLNSRVTDRSGETYYDNMCDFSNFKLNNYNDKIYSLEISYYHHGLSKEYDMIFLIN